MRLARLLAAGFAVPAGCCVTTTAYQRALWATGFSPIERWHSAMGRTGEDRRQFLHQCQSMIWNTDVAQLVDACLEEMRRIDGKPDRLWAVRSSATNEDAAQASFAGLYRTELGVVPEKIGRAIQDLWASIWDERVVAYAAESGAGTVPPAMAVVLQPVLHAQVSGVAYSIHPVTGRDNQVTVNAIRGLGAPLVDGLVTPDQYVVETGGDDQPSRVRRRIQAQQSERLVVGAQGL